MSDGVGWGCFCAILFLAFAVCYTGYDISDDHLGGLYPMEFKKVTDFAVDPITPDLEVRLVELGYLHEFWPEEWPGVLIADRLYQRAGEISQEIRELDETLEKPFDTLLPAIIIVISEVKRQVHVRSSIRVVKVRTPVLGVLVATPNCSGGITIDLENE